MMKRAVLIPLLLVAITIPMMMIITACPGGGGDSEKPKASFSMYSEQDPIPFVVTDGSGRNYWYYNYYVKETAGVGATLQSWNYQMFDANGASIGSGSHSVSDFVGWFTSCTSTVDGKIGPGGVLCSLQICASSTSNQAGWSAIDTMVFMDDNGNEITATGTFHFSAKP
jgi:hypothetical protein